jgi:hypothetical protein
MNLAWFIFYEMKVIPGGLTCALKKLAKEPQLTNWDLLV